MKVDGIWGLRFMPINGAAQVRESGGVVVLESGRIFGGDNWSYYTGFYEIEHSLLTFHIKSGLHYLQGGQSIFGGPLSEISFTGKGLIDKELITIDATLAVDDQPDCNLMARLTLACRLSK